MKSKLIYTIFALTAASLALILTFFIAGSPEQPVAAEVHAEDPPFVTYITGSGIVEPASGNVSISAPTSGVIDKVMVAINDQVKQGQELFRLASPVLDANYQLQKAKYEESRLQLQRLQAMPRSEDLAIAEQTFNKAVFAYQDAQRDYCVNYCRARTNQERWALFYKYQQAQADFLAAQAQFEKIQAGPWHPDLQIAENQVEQAWSALQVLQAQLQDTLVRSPMDGTVLMMKIHAGETLDPSRVAMIVGNTEQLNLRVGINQFNELKFDPYCNAVAYKQGDTTTAVKLRFLHTEPTMISKKYLTNELNEKVDAQIFEVVYRIEPNDFHLFVGEQMDVYIYDPD